MTLDEVIETMKAVPAQPADEFALRQLRLMCRLDQLIGCSDGSASWSWAAAALSADQTIVILQTALRVEAVGESADTLVSGRGCASRSRCRRCGWE